MEQNNTINQSQVDVQAQFNPAPQDQMFAIAQMMKQMMGELAEIKQGRTARKSSEPRARQDWRSAYRAACERTDKVEAGIQFFAATDEERKEWADAHDGVCIVKVDDMEYAFTPGIIESDDKGNLTWACEVCFKFGQMWVPTFTARRPRNGFYSMLRASTWIQAWQCARVAFECACFAVDQEWRLGDRGERFNEVDRWNRDEY